MSAPKIDKNRSEKMRAAWEEKHDEWAAKIKAGWRRKMLSRAVLISEEDPMQVFDGDDFR